MPVQEQGTQSVDGLVDVHPRVGLCVLLRLILILDIFYEDGGQRKGTISQDQCSAWIKNTGVPGCHMWWF